MRRRIPLGDDPSSLQESLQSRVQGPVIDDKLTLRLTFQELRNSVGMVGTQPEAAQDQHVERPLQKFEVLGLIV
jgi:hypothetical protein